jgi:hypothetical protein
LVDLTLHEVCPTECDGEVLAVFYSQE